MSKRSDREGFQPQGAFLRRWKARAKERRDRLERVLARPAQDTGKQNARVLWIQRTTNALATRREWLQARLEHVEALQAILQDALSGRPVRELDPAEADTDYSPDDLIAEPDATEIPRRR